MEEEQKSERILVIDDEPSIAELISDFCDSMGYQVKVLTESQKAIDVIQEYRPHLITLDLQMPQIDGFELLKMLKSKPETRHIPVIIVSVLAGDAERQGLLDAAQAILTKPINFQKFQNKVDEYVKNKNGN